MNIKRPISSLWSMGLILGSALTFSACAGEKTPAPNSSSTLPANNDTSPYINYGRPGSDPKAQQTGKESQYKITSRVMTTELPYRVVLPVDYNSNLSERYPVIYLLHGLTGHFNDWTDRTDLIQTASKYKFIIITPEGNDSWYSDSTVVPNSKYESYIISELIPEVDKRFRTMPDRQNRILAGLSMGGYGALKFGLKFPDRFSIVGSFSGALRIADWSESAGGNKLIGKSIDTIFGPVNSPARKANDIFRMANELSPARASSLPYIYMSCGTEDSMAEGNRAFDQLLTGKNVRHEYRTSRGGHDWTFWGEQMHTFLEFCNTRLSK